MPRTAKEEEQGRALQEAIRRLLKGLANTLITERDQFESLLDAATKKAGLKLPAPARKAILSAVSERDETAAICWDKDGNPEPDPELRDAERGRGDTFAVEANRTGARTARKRLGLENRTETV